jgi:hypothetical protein
MQSYLSSERILANDCPDVSATWIYDRCGVHYPQLILA